MELKFADFEKDTIRGLKAIRYMWGRMSPQDRAKTLMDVINIPLPAHTVSKRMLERSHTSTQKLNKLF